MLRWIGFGSAGLIHLVPLPGVLGAESLHRLYGIELLDSDLVLLLRHRAVLFGLLGLALLAAIRWPALRAPALIGGSVSALGFLLLALDSGPLGAALTPILVGDIVALFGLLIAAVEHLSRPRDPNL
jgi:hypothetical protein